MIEVVMIQRREGVWQVGIGHVSTNVIVRGLQTFRGSGSATKAARAMAERTGLLIVRQRAGDGGKR